MQNIIYEFLSQKTQKLPSRYIIKIEDKEDEENFTNIPAKITINKNHIDEDMMDVIFQITIQKVDLKNCELTFTVEKEINDMIKKIADWFQDLNVFKKSSIQQISEIIKKLTEQFEVEKLNTYRIINIKEKIINRNKLEMQFNFSNVPQIQEINNNTKPQRI